MPRVVAYKCPHTSQVFEFKKDYTNHLRRLSRARQSAKKAQEIKVAREARWTEFRNAITSVDQLPSMIIKHQDLFWETASLTGRDFEICRISGIWPRLVEFTEFNLRFSEHVSNTHTCPVNGVTNWGGHKKDAPRGYPGWSGRICWIVEWPQQYTRHYPGGGLFVGSRINTGTGGGGHDLVRQNVECKSFGYGVEIFGDDWEVMYKTYRKNCFVKTLKGERR